MKYSLFEVRLLHVDTPPWRRFLLRENATFDELHEAIQDACGWENSHLYAFHGEEPGPPIAGPLEDDGWGPPTPDAAKVLVSSYFTAGGPSSCTYTYDFGDDWLHEVRWVESVLEPKRLERRLVDGALAFPPEDCGGIPGYLDCLALTRGEKPQFRDAAALKEWLEEGWDPAAFDVAAVKKEFDR